MNFLILQHLEIEPAALIEVVMADAGHAIDTVHIDRGEAVPSQLDGYDGVVVMGGPMSANDTHLSYVVNELTLLGKAVEADFPVLGICLGAQILARAAGAEIVASPVRELGWYPVQRTWESAADPIFRRLPDDGLMVFQWHGETFTLPECATLVATHPAVPHQAFRIGSSQYGLQFHIEVDAKIIDSWMEAGESERAELGEAGLSAIQSATPEHLAAAQLFCREMVAAWLQLCANRVARDH